MMLATRLMQHSLKCDYFKKEAIEWSYEFLTSKTEGLGLDPSRLYVTVFEGDENSSRDDEAANIWKEIFKKNNVSGYGADTLKGESGRIFYLPAANNWWQAGENGPCGPDSEMFYDISNKFRGTTLTKAEYLAADEARDVVEVWNDVFMQYEKKDGKIVGKLPKPSVDTGAGLERLAMTLQGVDNIYDTDLFKYVMRSISKNDPWNTIQTSLDEDKRFGSNKHKQSIRIIADHTRASVFLIADGVIPSNTDRGYILRRLLRRAIYRCTENSIQLTPHHLVYDIAETYKESYPYILEKASEITKIIQEEELRFLKTLESGKKELRKMAMGLVQISTSDNVVENASLEVNGKNLFYIYSSYGFPFESSVEEINHIRSSLGKHTAPEPLSGENMQKLWNEFQTEFKKHQDLSRAGAEQKFKGGLADANDPQVIKYHTATHLLHQALHDVLGDSVMQKGSNITTERLRFDFSHGTKMTDDEKKRVEDIVNEKIQAALPVQQLIMDKDQAEKTGARHFFGDKYGDKVSIYFVGQNLETAYSKEFCGGPHVKNTSELGHFKIAKEEAVAQGVRRIKAVLD